MGTLNQQVGRVQPQQIYMLHALNLMNFKRVSRKGAGLAACAIYKVWQKRSMTPLKFNKMCRSELKVRSQTYRTFANNCGRLKEHRMHK